MGFGECTETNSTERLLSSLVAAVMFANEQLKASAADNVLCGQPTFKGY